MSAQAPDVFLKTIDIPESGLLLVSVPKPVTMEEAQRIIAYVKRELGERRYVPPVLVADGGVKIEALTDEQLAKLGLMRIPQTE